MIRGDSESLTISMETNEGFDEYFKDGDIVYFTVKETIATDKKILQKIITSFVDGKAIIEILPTDTQDLRVKDYVYDIQLTKGDESVTTIVKPSKFSLLGDVTRE